MASDDPELAIRSWAGMYGGKWLVVRVPDRRILTSGTLEHCIRWVRDFGAGPEARARGAELSAACRL